MIKSNLAKSNVNSPLERTQWLKNNGESRSENNSLAPILPLTSLIDAFCIIVIYLLIGTQSGTLEVPVSDHMHLPKAEANIALDKELPILRIENGIYFINDKPVRPSELSVALIDLKKSTATGTDGAELLIQADTTMSYADLDPVLKAGSAAGIEKLKFAVMPKQ
jgi:biopolymer transport protein ExbD